MPHGKKHRPPQHQEPGTSSRPSKSRKNNEHPTSKVIADLIQELKRAEEQPLHAIESLKAKKVCPLDGVAYQIASDLYGHVNPTQLRRLFGPIKAIATKTRRARSKEQDYSAGLVELIPIAMYAAGRTRDAIYLQFAELLARLIQRCVVGRNPQDLETLERFLTSIVAWYKYKEAREKTKSEPTNGGADK